MKKFLCIIFAIIILLALPGCDRPDGSAPSGKDETQSTSGTNNNTTGPATVGSTDSADSSTGGTTDAPETIDPATTEANTSGSIDTDENLFAVEITLPASMFEGEDMSDFDTAKYAEENGFIDATVNDDGSVTITMTKKKHRELLAEMARSLEETFTGFIDAEDTPYIKAITHNDDFSSIVIKVSRADYENAFDFTAFTVGFSAMFYQSFLDMEYHVEVSVVDADTGDTISTTVYPDAFGD